MLDRLLGALALPTRGRPALLVDLPIEATLTTTPILAKHGWYVVPVIQRWMAQPAVLPCARLLDRLLAVGALVRPPATPRGVVLLADGERRGRPGPIQGSAFDNRYSYQICRFPPPALLAAFGVETIRWLTPMRVASDLKGYADTLVAAGLGVEMTVSGVGG
ncbi:MAG: hypothetical protein IT305_00345 [Chloroflexi bacterium]|nr:hypothetical protein [Chloroflexota bacterium]